MFRVVNIYANIARSKRIEGYFKQLRYGTEKRREGWIARPFALDESNQAGPGDKKLIPYDKLVRNCFADIVEWNNSPNGQDKTISRFDYFIQRQHPDLKQTNYKAFLRHLGHRTSTSCNAGIMKLQQREWLLGDSGEIYTGEQLVGLLRAVEGKDVDIYWLDGNDGGVIKALVYDKSGHYICEALPKPVSARSKLEETDAHRAAREIMSRYRSTITEYMKTRKNAIDTVVLVEDKRKHTISNSFTIPGFSPVAEEVVEETADAVEEAPEYSGQPLDSGEGGRPDGEKWKDRFGF